MTMIQNIDIWLAPTKTTAGRINPLFRLLTSLIFIIGGLGHFGEHRQMLDRMAESPWRGIVSAIGDPSVLLWLSGGVFVIFGTALAVGYMTRLSALLLLVTLIPITIAVHVAPGHIGPLFKNVAIMGALLYFYANGAGTYSFDRLRTQG